MKIAIDISQIVYGTGVSSYTKQLVAHLLELRSGNDFLLFAGSLRRGGEIKKMFPQSKVFPLPPSLSNLLWNRLHVLPLENLIGKTDVVHTSDWAEPPAHAVKVTTVHDLSPFLYPNLFPRDILRDIVSVHKSKLGWVKEESRRIIVPTTATKTDLVEMGFNEKIIRVIPEGVDPMFSVQSSEEISAIKSKYKLHDKYIMGVGIGLRKNTERIVKAFELASAGKDLKLVLVGQAKYGQIKENRNVRILGHITNRELAALYGGATALVYPSLYEGFGLPILEAMASGCPVITSNISSMAEVAGDAALLVDPYEVEDIKSAIEKVIRGAKAFSEKGLKHAKNFSWRVSAEKTMEVYTEAYKDN